MEQIILAGRGRKERRMVKVVMAKMTKYKLNMCENNEHGEDRFARRRRSELKVDYTDRMM